MREEPRLRAESKNRSGKRRLAGDFPREDYEASWQGRFTLEDLNIHGNGAGYAGLIVIQPLRLDGGMAFARPDPPYRIAYHQRAMQQ